MIPVLVEALPERISINIPITKIKRTDMTTSTTVLLNIFSRPFILMTKAEYTTTERISEKILG